MLSLNATFENSAGRRHSFRLKDPDRNKPAEEIRASLEKLASLNLFEKDGVGLFKKVISAKFVETIETPIFDVRKDNDGIEAVPAVQPETAQIEEVAAIEVQPESVHIQEVPAVEAPVTKEAVTKAQPESIQVPQPSFIASQAANALLQSAPQPVTAQAAKPVPDQIQDKPVSQGGTLQLHVIVPKDYQPNQLSNEELEALLRTGVPEGARLEDFSLEDIVLEMEESGKTALVAEQITSPPVEQSLERIEETTEEPGKKASWFPKRKKRHQSLSRLFHR